MEDDDDFFSVADMNKECGIIPYSKSPILVKDEDEQEHEQSPGPRTRQRKAKDKRRRLIDDEISYHQAKSDEFTASPNSSLSTPSSPLDSPSPESPPKKPKQTKKLTTGWKQIEQVAHNGISFRVADYVLAQEWREGYCRSFHIVQILRLRRRDLPSFSQEAFIHWEGYSNAANEWLDMSKIFLLEVLEPYSPKKKGESVFALYATKPDEPEGYFPGKVMSMDEKWFRTSIKFGSGSGEVIHQIPYFKIFRISRGS